jgi:hypothetical protein
LLLEPRARSEHKNALSNISLSCPDGTSLVRLLARLGRKEVLKAHAT